MEGGGTAWNGGITAGAGGNLGPAPNGPVGGGATNPGGGMDGFTIGGTTTENVECYYKNTYTLFCKRHPDLPIFCSENNKLVVQY